MGLVDFARDAYEFNLKVKRDRRAQDAYVREQGRIEGREERSSEIKSLYFYLEEKNRPEEFELALKDEACMRRLLEEMKQQR